MSTSLATRVQPGGAIQQAAPQKLGRLSGADETDFVLPRIHLFQGLPAEAKLYPGKHKSGDLVNSLTFEKLKVDKFMPILGWKEWIKWSPERGKGIVYRTKFKNEVPAEDLEWNRETNAPPAVTEYINFAVIFEGDTSPVVLSFARTQYKGGQTLHTLESLRGRRGPGLYKFGTREKSNEKGEWLIPHIQPVGDPPAELTELASILFDSMSGSEIKTNIDPSEGESDAE